MAKGDHPIRKPFRDIQNFRDGIKKRYRDAPNELKLHVITVLRNLYYKGGVGLAQLLSVFTKLIHQVESLLRSRSGAIAT